MSNQMEYKDLMIGVHHPQYTPDRGRNLAPRARWDVHRVAHYDDGTLPGNWQRDQTDQGYPILSYFFGVKEGHETWFNFCGMSNHPYDIAVLVTVQGVNALTPQLGRSTGLRLEQYRHNCPLHQTAFGEERFCHACGYCWPPQNYVTSAGGADANTFWLDGFCTVPGTVQQFVFSNKGELLGVAEQVIGESRPAGISFAVFLSKHLRKTYHEKETLLYRRANPSTEQDLLDQAERDFESGVSPFDLLDDGEETLLGGRSALRRESFTRGSYEDSAEETLISRRHTGDRPDRGSYRSLEVSAGREVGQKIHLDPNEPTYWEPEPAVVFVLTPAPYEIVREHTRNGPTVDPAAKGKGSLQGLNLVGNRTGYRKAVQE